VTRAAGHSMLTASLVVIAGVVAALQVGKLPPALPSLQADLGLSLVESGFLLSMVQLAGMLTAILVGLVADGFGLRRSMYWGLLVLSGASALGSLCTQTAPLLLLRAIEGMAFLWVSLPAPALIRRLVPPGRLASMLGVWGAYMPLGTALALLGGPFFIPNFGWSGWWLLFSVLSLLMAAVLYRMVPLDVELPVRSAHELRRSLATTLGQRGPWLVAVMFGMYSAQWLALMGFLPVIYSQAGLGGAAIGWLTASAAAVNMLGNLASGRLLQAGRPAHKLLWMGYACMALGSLVAFASWTDGMPWLRFAGVLLFSSVGGLVPATLFALAVRLAPSDRQVATSVGWAQQWSALGQFFGPPLVAWVAARAGGWHLTPWVTGSCCLAGVTLAWVTAHHLDRLAQQGARP